MGLRFTCAGEEHGQICIDKLMEETGVPGQNHRPVASR